jgi:hypothetical protein
VANVLAPFGFSYVGRMDGSPPNAGLFTALITSGNTTAIFRGDWCHQLNTGYIAQAAAADGGIGAGVFWGCRYYSVSGKIPKWSPYWPGSDAAGTVEAFLINDPQALFLVQCGGLSGSALPLTAVGKNADIDLTTAGNTNNGISGMALDDNVVGTTSTLPFHIVRRFSDPVDGPQTGPGITGQNGTDNTTQYNYAYVTINAAVLKAGQTGV